MCRLCGEDFLSDVNVDPRLISSEQLFSPLLAHVSGPRAAMFAKQLSQAIIIDGGEHPLFMTGYENIFAQYAYKATKTKSDVKVVETVPKFKRSGGMIDSIMVNPETTVIVEDVVSGEFDCFPLRTFVQGSDGFGFDNCWINREKLRSGNIIPKGTEFTHSKARIGNEYRLGLNVDCVTLSTPEIAEDAIIISDELAEKMTSTSFHTVDIKIGPQQVPLNPYGSDDEWKFMPDIGECVGNHGILAGFRSPTELSFASDMNPEALKTPQYLHDTLYSAPPGAEIVDIDVTLNMRNFNALKSSGFFFSQLDKYHQQNIRYYRQIVEIYRTHKPKKISGRLNTLIARAYNMLKMYKVVRHNSTITPAVNADPVELASVKITYREKRRVAPGFKLSGRDGSKGVISAIYPVENMPVTPSGKRAHMIYGPESPVNRLCSSQDYEQIFGAVSREVQRNVGEMLSGTHDRVDEAFTYLLDYIERFKPAERKLIESYNLNHSQKKQLLEDTALNGPKVQILPFTDRIGPEFTLKLAEDYGVEKEHVTFVTFDGRRVTSKEPVLVGPKYMYLLYKIPEVYGVSMGYTNQLRVPIHPGEEAKKTLPIKNTPGRLGVDEIRNIVLASDQETAARLMLMHGSSHEALNNLGYRLLTEKNPSAIEEIDLTTEEIVEGSTMIKAIQHALSIAGFQFDKGL